MATNFFKIRQGLTLPGTTAPSNPIDGDVYFDSVQGFLGYQNGSWGPLGGSGVINYNTNPSIGSTVGYNLYNNGAVATPINGTGGTVTNLTFASTQTNPLIGHTMGVLTKAAANAQGEGLSYDFTIDPAFSPGVIQISYSYQGSANFALSSGLYGSNSDIEMWVYDKTNSVIIPVTPNVLTSGVTTPGTFTGSFQTASTSTSYRLIWHIATTNALAWTFNLVNVVIGPEVPVVTGTPQVSAIYTSSTAQGPGAPFLINFETQVEDTTSSVSNPSSTWTFTAPYSGLYHIDTCLAQQADTQPQLVTAIYHNGSPYAGQIFTAASPGQSTLLSISASANIRLIAGDTIQVYGQGNTATTSGQPQYNRISINLIQPTLSAAGGYGNAAKMLAQTATGGITGGGTPVVFETVLEDNYGAYNPTTGIYTAPVSGTYLVTGSVVWVQTTNYLWEMQIWHNGTPIADTRQYQEGATLTVTETMTLIRHVVMAAGDTIQIMNTGDSNSAVGTLIQNYLDIVQIIPPLPVPPVSAVIGTTTLSTSTSVASSAPLPFDTVVFDTYGGFVTNPYTYTVKVAGYYNVTCAIQNFGTGSFVEMQIWVQKNGTFARYLCGANGTTGLIGGGSGIVSCQVGDTLQLASNTGTNALENTSSFNVALIK